MRNILMMFSFFNNFFFLSFLGGSSSSSNQFTSSENLNNSINFSLGSFGASENGSSFTPTTKQTSRLDQTQDNGVGASVGILGGSGGTVAQSKAPSSPINASTNLPHTATAPNSIQSLLTPINIGIAVIGYLVYKKIKK